MPTEGTGLIHPITEEKPMAQVTYRGVKYDTDTRKATSTQQVQETYRGVKFQKELASA